MASQPDGEDCSPRGLWDPQSKHKQKQSSGPPGSRLPLVSGPRGPGACWKVSSSLLCRETLPLSCPASGGLRLGADASRRRGWPALFP